jgi:hypothetical protein
MKTHLAWLCVAMAAFVIGTQLGKKEVRVIEKTIVAPKPNDTHESVPGPSNVPRDLSGSSASVQDQSGTAPLVRVNMLRDLKKRQVANIRLPVVYNNGNLSEGFAELFSLSPSEADALRSAIKEAHSEIGRLSQANASITQQGASTIVTVQPFEGGADVYDRLMDSFERTLGPDRYAAMIELHTDELPRVFSGYGAEQRTLMIVRDARKESRFRIDDSRRTASGSISRTVYVSNPSELSDSYSWLASVLPQVPASPNARP